MKIRFLKEVPVGHKVYRPNDEADADIVRGTLWVRSSGSRTGRRLEADDFEFVIDQTDFDELLEGEEDVTQTTYAMPEVSHVHDGELVKLVDGDSFYVRLDTKLDKNVGAEEVAELRLLGLNCPEVHGAQKEAGLKAAAFTALFLREDGASAAKLAWNLRVQTFGREKFGRLLARVWRKSDGACLNTALLESGNAEPYLVMRQLREARR